MTLTLDRDTLKDMLAEAERVEAESLARLARAKWEHEQACKRRDLIDRYFLETFGKEK